MTTASQFGHLWGRGHETFTPSLRRILSIKGEMATTFLQGLVTSDLTQDPIAPKGHINAEMDLPEDDPLVVFNPNLRTTCFLDNRGRIVTDAFLWKMTERNENNDQHYLIDVPSNSANALMDHLQKYKLRRTRVTVSDVSDKVSSHVFYGTLNASGPPPGYTVGLDPRHPSMGVRVISTEHPVDHFPSLIAKGFPDCPGTYNVLRKFTGIAEGIELKGKTALETNQEWLNAVSFHKGCYLGQELTARSQFTGVIRKRIMPLLLIDTRTEVPRPWVLAHHMQENPLAKLKEELKIQTPLPNLSSPSVGALLTMLAMGSIVPPKNNRAYEGTDTDTDDQENEKEKDATIKLEQEMQEFVDELHDGISSESSATKIIDTVDNKTIGQIVSAPAPGTSILLAQMRLDRVGFSNNGKTPWSRLNKVRLGNMKKEYRYLPYTPLWWPIIDTKTGKAREPEEEAVEENEGMS
mmetsp:Transcript_20212/g.22589  ORF Transcript_20212/g.22589 Transcript_20212/m.22589 type:complete len:465 (+) Transcript_20212:123-1517(+)|eukprot:CAMPEP_0194150016 /NCGR_PEP_ID=MMETSP0152-20130528/41047_1 /TAXON_ID=1049557 /ORGANISM="Thalassiothrix antarctica, Strain L6-D1" /LENGTH=464 /DNA_ID=CAMNT_0038852633 /DNA_START=94 /DNA_END=1488 /DNA_ORIENTATION=-